MKKFDVKLKYRQQLITTSVWAMSQEIAELLAKEHAVKRIDPRKQIWPPVIQGLKIIEIKRAMNSQKKRVKS